MSATISIRFHLAILVCPEIGEVWENFHRKYNQMEHLLADASEMNSFLTKENQRLIKENWCLRNQLDHENPDEYC